MKTEITVVNDRCSFAMDDRTFWGEALVETLKVDDEKPRYSALHWLRMRDASAMLGIPFEISNAQWDQQLEQSIQKAHLTTGGVRVILTPGRAPRGLNATGASPRLIFYAFTYAPIQKPLCLISSSWLRDALNPIYLFKSINYLEAILARRQGAMVGADDVLFFNQQGHATETTIANFFIIKQNCIVTPLLTDGVLAGIMRGRVIALCRNMGMACIEQSIDKTMIEKADLVFVTNVLQGIRVVESWDGYVFQMTHPLITLLEASLIKDNVY